MFTGVAEYSGHAEFSNSALELGLYLNLQLWDLLLELSHSCNVVSFSQPHCHHLFLTLQKTTFMCLYVYSFSFQVARLCFRDGCPCRGSVIEEFVPCTQSQLVSSWSLAAAPAGLCFALSECPYGPGHCDSPAPLAAAGYCEFDSEVAQEEKKKTFPAKGTFKHWKGRGGGGEVPCQIFELYGTNI